MGGQAARDGGRGGGSGRRLEGEGGRAQRSGQGVRQRRRDGSGRGAEITNGVAVAVTAPALVADVPACAPAIVARARTVAVLAKPESCIPCGACIETCPQGAIALGETAVIDPQLCNGCGMCVDDCSYGALALAEV